MAAYNPEPKLNYSVKAYTPCKGKITLDEKDYAITQTYRENIKKLLDQLFIGTTYEELIGLKEGKHIEIERTVPVKTLIYEVPPKSREEQLIQRRPTGKKMKATINEKYMCPVLSKDDEEYLSNFIIEEQEYLKKLLNWVEASEERQYYVNNKIPALNDVGTIERPGYIIIPNQQKYPITKEDIDELEKIKGEFDKISKDYINLLCRFEFHYYTKGEPKKITEYSLEDCERIIIHIKQFYMDKFGVNLDRDEFKHMPYHYFDKRNQEPRWRLTFGLFPVHTGYSYTVYERHSKQIDLFEMMSILKSNPDKDLVYFREVFSEYEGDIGKLCEGETDGLIKNIHLEMDRYCKETPERTGGKKGGGKKYRLAGGTAIDPTMFEIVNHYAFSDKAVNCTDVVQIRVKKWKGYKYFTVSLKNITFDKLGWRQEDKKTAKQFIKEFMDYLSTSVNGVPSYSEGSGATYIEPTLSWIKVSIKGSTPLNDVRYIAIEKGVNYWGKDGIVNKIKGTVVSVSNLLVLFVLSHIREEGIQDKKKAFHVKDLLNSGRIDNKRFLNIVEKLHENKYFRRLTYQLVLFDNFVAFKSPDKHIIWFCPAGFNIKMDKIDIFEVLVNRVLELIAKKNPISVSDGDKLEFEMIDDEEIANYLDNSTTYTNEFNGDLFMYNVRHIDGIRAVEIDGVISDYLKISKICGNFYVYAKYPSTFKDNILHFHILDFDYGNVRKRELANINIRYIEEIQNAILWERIKFSGISYSDIRMGYPPSEKRLELSGREKLVESDYGTIKSFWIEASS